jgi:sialate O-acetylesterase
MRPSRSARFLVPALLAATLFAAVPARAALGLPPIFGSGMVLQRNLPIPIWGTAAGGDKVVVEFAGQQKTTQADSAGKWRIVLDPLETSAVSRTLTVTVGAGDKAEKKEFADVLVGEVWVGSGQSNMAIASGSFTNQDPVLAANVAGSYPLLRLCRGAMYGGWRAATNDNANFSALLFSFGLSLQQQLGIPVGLLPGAASGTPSGYWISERAYLADPGCQADVEKANAVFDPVGNAAQHAYRMSTWSQAVATAAQAGKPAPAQPSPGLKPGECRAKIGNLYETYIRPFQPYAIRGVLWDQGESGTAIGGVAQKTLMSALVRGWRQEWGQGDFPFLVVQKPSGGGCAWDPADPVTRAANTPAPLPPQVPNSGYSREEYLLLGRIPGVSLVISSDLGGGIHPICKSGYGARAARAALGAVYGRPMEFAGPTLKAFAVEGGKVRLQFNHIGQGLAIPTTSATATNAPAAVLQGFAIAGTNRVFQWARAAIEGNTVVLENDKVPQPVAVRYAWADSHPWANLFNKDGLPAQAFRTDSW